MDRTRVYVTGISMGGAGVWYLGARLPGTFAALVPVCGGVNYPAAASGHSGSEENRVIYLARAESIAATPVWAFHGADDTVVHPGFTQGMIDALRGLSYAPRHTEYPHCGHAVWELPYSKAELWSWLLEQRLNDTLGQR